MNRSLTAATTAAAALAVVLPLSLSAPASAAARGSEDLLGDSTTGRAFDFVGFEVRNSARAVVASFDMATLAPSRRTVVATVNMRLPGSQARYAVVTRRSFEGVIRTRLTTTASDSAAPQRVRCRVTATWGEADTSVIRIRVPQSCLPRAPRATFRPSTALVAGSQDPSDVLDTEDGAAGGLRVPRG